MKKLRALLIGVLFSFSSVIFAESPEDYTLAFFKIFNKTQEKLTYMNKPGSLEKMGTETVNGDISGTVFYDVKLKGLGALVILRYTNYCDEEGWIFDGEIITHSSMTKNGTFEGTIKLTGKAPGQVTYNNVLLKKGQPGGGYYLVSTPDFTDAEVDYTVYLKSKNQD